MDFGFLKMDLDLPSLQIGAAIVKSLFVILSIILVYAVFMLILLLCELRTIMFIFSERHVFMEQVNNIVEQIWALSLFEPKLMTLMQVKYNCCGYDGVHDYITMGEIVPNSCCGESATSCSAEEAMLKQGCSKAFSSFWEMKLNAILFDGWSIAAVELTLFMFACFLSVHKRLNRLRAIR